MRPLTIAVPKGRVLTKLVPLFEKAGIATDALMAESRLLVRESGGVRFFLLKPSDVPVYVEYGAADLGVVGRDVVDEKRSDVYAPLDLGIGKCRLAVARKVGAAPRGDRLRIATKYPRTALAHFESKGQDVDIISLEGSVELAAVTGLADAIVDIVETGDTLRENGLEVVETVSHVTSVLIANRVSYKLRSTEILALIERLEANL